jgi:hypothetical protein
MGIANFQKWLRQNRLAEPIKAGSHLSTALLAVDFQHILHQCIQKCPSTFEFRERVIRSLTKMMTTIQFEVIGLFLDGSAPKAKHREQKRRRKRRRYKRKSDEFLPSDILRPGSQELLMLELHLRTFFRENKVNYYFSSSSKRGEGEIKLTRWLKAKKFAYKKKILYGGDSDLLPIAASLGFDTRIILIHQKDRLLIKISRVISAFVLRDIESKEERIKEFIGMCILLGNDYLPKIPGLGFTTLLEANKYRKGPCLIDDDHDFSKKALKSLLEQVRPTCTNNTDERDPQWYLHGLNWCAKLYLQGVCIDYHYSYDGGPPWILQMIKYL